MKNHLTEIIFILDKSTSMGFLKEQAIDGFNSFLKEQQSLGEKANLTLVLFNHEYMVKYDGVDIQQVKPLEASDYITSGMTAYFDALGVAIDGVGERLSLTPEDERPNGVIFAIMTDGEENSSKKYTANKIKEMVQHQEEKYNWKFIFLAANQDAFKSANDIGITNYTNFGYSGQGVYNACATMSKSVSDYRSTGTIEQMPENVGG